MTPLEMLARELAAEDVRNGVPRIKGHDEMVATLITRLRAVYDKVYPEVAAVVRTLTDEKCTCAALVCKVHGRTWT